jgi:hypothetical protein
MNLQARRKSGSQFSSDDVLEAVFDSDNQEMSEVVHTIELISGPVVTHGGGGTEGTYLHYKSHEEDADANGDIDYSTVFVKVDQESKGTSVIKVIAKLMTVENAIAFKTLLDSFVETPNEGELIESPAIEDYQTILKSGEITLEWGDDTLV